MIVHLRPRAPFTKGAPRSDTMFGAIAWAIRWLYGETALVDLLEQTEAAVEAGAQPPLVISSLFPSLSDRKGKILLLPKPLLPPAFGESLHNLQDYRRAKEFRRAKYVSRRVFEEIASGRLNESALQSDIGRGDESRYCLASDAIVTREEAGRLRPLQKLVVEGETARNTINRLSVSTSDGGTLFYEPIASGRALHSIGVESGFYLIVRTGGERAEEVHETVKSALRFLGDKGFGGDTTIGRGHCEVSFDDADDIDGDPQGTRLVTLSLMHPGPGDLAHLAAQQTSVYAKLEKRKGFIESSYSNEVRRIWKPTLFMLVEGSTFPRNAERQVYGKLFADGSRREGMKHRTRINGLACTAAIRESAGESA